MDDRHYFVYIITNPKRTVLYTGVTNNLHRRLTEHYEDNVNGKKSFAARYFCYHLVYFEAHTYINNAIQREKEIKGWTRKKKEALINEFNPDWKFLNDAI